MRNGNLIAAATICTSVVVVGIVLYQQNERHFSDSQRWFEVCKRQLDKQAKSAAENIRDDSSIPEDVRKSAQLGIEGWDEDYLYSTCYKQWHAGPD
jgi:hypothetical protein